MGKKKFDNRGKARRKATREDDAAWRVTHLLTASHLLHTTAPAASRWLMRTGMHIGRRVTLTMDCVTVKRMVCGKCHTLLTPAGDAPARVRVAPRRETHVVVTCGRCGFVKRYPVRDRAGRDDGGGSGGDDGTNRTGGDGKNSVGGGDDGKTSAGGGDEKTSSGGGDGKTSTGGGDGKNSVGGGGGKNNKRGSIVEGSMEKSAKAARWKQRESSPQSKDKVVSKAPAAMPCGLQ